jgi:hypothetical protein
MRIETGGKTIDYDSTKENPGGNPLAEYFKALVGSEFKLTLSPEMKIVKIEGREEFVKKVINANPQMGPLLQQILSEDAMKEMADPTFAVVPNKPVMKDDSWTKESKLSMGPIGSYGIQYRYTYEGSQDGLARIKLDMTGSYKPPEKNQAGVLPFVVKEADLRFSDASGTLLFDLRRGRMRSSRSNLKVEGTLVIEINGSLTPVQLFQTQVTTVELTGEN